MLHFSDGPEPLDRLIGLRRWQSADEDVLIEGCGDAAVALWMPRMPYPYGHQDAKHFFERAAVGWESGTLATLAVLREEEVVGSVSFRLADPDVPEVHGAYWATPRGRGHGFISAAVRCVSDWAIGELGVMRYELRTDPHNEPSCQVARAAGFEREGIIRCAYRRRDGTLQDLISWSRTAPRP